MKNAERHVLACALKVEELHGDQAPLHISERIGALALAGDVKGVAMWKRIARAYDELSGNQRSSN